MLQDTYKINPAKTLMVGDRLDSDVTFGNMNNIDTLLVLTGSHKLKDVEEAEKRGDSVQIPKFYGNSIQVILGNKGNDEAQS